MRTPLMVALSLALPSDLVRGQDLYVCAREFNNGRILVMGLDGSNARTAFTLPLDLWAPNGLAYQPNTDQFFITDAAISGDVLRTDGTGSSLTTLSSFAGFPRGASLDADGRIYFGVGNTIRRVNSDGTSPTTIFISEGAVDVGSPRVDATNGHVYFGDRGEIRRVNLDGSNMKTIVRGCGLPVAVALDVAAGFIYWVDASANSDFVGRAGLDGSRFTVLVDASPSVYASSGLIDIMVLPSRSMIVVVDEFGRVMTAPLAGGAFTTIYQAPPTTNLAHFAWRGGEPVQAVRDCDRDGVSDDAQIAAGDADCDENGVPDSCQSGACPTRTLLLDQGTGLVDGQGRTISANGWRSYQPFDVPTEGWAIHEIGTDGVTFNWHDGSGFEATLFPTRPTEDLPDESMPLASTTGNFDFNFGSGDWVYLPMRAQLPRGRFWVRFQAASPTTYSSTILYGVRGLGARSRERNGRFGGPSIPLAFRVVGRVGCRSDFNGDGFVDFFDFVSFAACFEGSGSPGCDADFNGDGFIDFFDYDDFVAAFEAAC
jgi:hypothetical protein